MRGWIAGILVRIYLEARYIASWSFVLAHVDVVQCLASIVDVVTGCGCGSVPSRGVKKVVLVIRGSLVARCVGRVVVELLKGLLGQTDYVEEVMRDYIRHYVFYFWKLVFRRPAVLSVTREVWRERVGQAVVVLYSWVLCA